MMSVIDGAKLKALRKARRWDQQTLAHFAGVDASVVSRLERHEQKDVRASILVRLARALGVTADTLLGGPAEEIANGIVPELVPALGQLGNLSKGNQRIVAAVLNALIAALPPAPDVKERGEDSS